MTAVCSFSPCTGGRIDFGTFLELMYQHSQVEKCQQDILAAFKAHDKGGRGKVPASELVHILSNFGEKLSRAEGLCSLLLLDSVSAFSLKKKGGFNSCFCRPPSQARDAGWRQCDVRLCVS